MRLYRPSCNLEFLAYFVVFAALEQQLRNLLFSRGQLNSCFLHEFPQIRNARTPERPEGHSNRMQSLFMPGDLLSDGRNLSISRVPKLIAFAVPRLNGFSQAITNSGQVSAGLRVAQLFER